jgi:hypothetical protein
VEILRTDLQNKDRIEQLAEMKLDQMGIGEDPATKDCPRFWANVKEYFIGMIQEHLSNSEDNVLTEYFDDSELALWGFIAGWKAALLTN